jgi:hypothetical protein
VERVAVIDMGSNSWRLVVFGYEPGTPWWSLVDEIREAVRIGAGMGEQSTPGEHAVRASDPGPGEHAVRASDPGPGETVRAPA